MTYNTPILLNVDTAFNVVLGSTVTLDKDHSTERECATTGDFTTGNGCPE